MTVTQYKRVRNGQDLIDAGVIPKTSSTTYAIIAEKRLRTLADLIESDIDQADLGQWTPLFEKKGPKDNPAYTLREGAVADKDRGHYIRLGNDIEHNARGKTLKYVKGSIGKLVEADGQTCKIEVEDEEKGKRNILHVNINAVADTEVSTLGQYVPKDLKEVVKTETLRQYFPHAILAAETAEEVILTLMMGKDMVFHGPPGCGKSEAAMDIMSFYPSIQFVVDGCKGANCNPYSVFEEKFSTEKVPPCGECMIHFDPGYAATGEFKRPSPEKVPVKVIKPSQGFGIEIFDGKESVTTADLVGYKIPDLSGAVDENPYDPKGFRHGVLIRTNNGLVIIDELDKIHPHVVKALLPALARNMVTPAELRFPYPTNALVIGTANNIDVLPPEINDRMVYIRFSYPEDRDDSYEIVRRAYHGIRGKGSEVDIGDVHKEQRSPLRDVPLSVILERAMDAMYHKIRHEGVDKEQNMYVTSVRSLLEALDAARAKHLFDSTFLDDGTEAVTIDQAKFGIKYAFRSRNSGSSAAEMEKKDKSISDFVEQHFTKVLEEETNTWWCKLYKRIAALDMRVSGYAAKFEEEVKKYEKDDEALRDAVKGFLEIHRSAATRPLTSTKIIEEYEANHPFMDYLSEEQARFHKFSENTLVLVIKDILKSREKAKATCT